MESIRKLPVAFGVALLQNPRAMQRFYQLSPGQRRDLVAQTQSIRSREDMKAFVDTLSQPEF